MIMEDYYFYILKGINNQYYKGITYNINKRLRQHELGQNKTTKKMKNFKLVYVEICRNRLEARKLEKYFKSGIGREIIKEIFG